MIMRIGSPIQTAVLYTRVECGSRAKIGVTKEVRVAVQTVYHDAERHSHILLLVIPAAGYLAVTAIVAVLVFEKLGVGITAPRLVEPRSDLGRRAGGDRRRDADAIARRRTDSKERRQSDVNCVKDRCAPYLVAVLGSEKVVTSDSAEGPP
jgi:hypothetical protein